MQVKFVRHIDSEHLQSELSRVAAFLKESGAESVADLVVSCRPWRRGKELQAFDTLGNSCAVEFTAASGSPGAAAESESGAINNVVVRERSDAPRKRGLAAMIDPNEF